MDWEKKFEELHDLISSRPKEIKERFSLNPKAFIFFPSEYVSIYDIVNSEQVSKIISSANSNVKIQPGNIDERLLNERFDAATKIVRTQQFQNDDAKSSNLLGRMIDKGRTILSDRQAESRYYTWAQRQAGVIEEVPVNVNTDESLEADLNRIRADRDRWKKLAGESFSFLSFVKLKPVVFSSYTVAIILATALIVGSLNRDEYIEPTSDSTPTPTLAIATPIVAARRSEGTKAIGKIEYETNENELKLRSRPMITPETILRVFPLGATLYTQGCGETYIQREVGKADVEWLKVRASDTGEEGWVARKYINRSTPLPVLNQNSEIKAPIGVWLRDCPDSECKGIVFIDKGDTAVATIEEVQNSNDKSVWMKVEYQGYVGWSNKARLFCDK